MALPGVAGDVGGIGHEVAVCGFVHAFASLRGIGFDLAMTSLWVRVLLIESQTCFPRR
jgi:hypothetical protein